MFCINCYNADTKVTNSRSRKKQPSIWRRRHCDNCGIYFTTLEYPDATSILQLRNEKTNHIEKYQKGRLLLSMAQALHAVGGDPSDAYWLTETVEQHAIAFLRHHPDLHNMLTVSCLGDIAYGVLCRYHTVAGLSYGAAHGIVQSGTQKKRPGRPRQY